MKFLPLLVLCFLLISSGPLWAGKDAWVKSNWATVYSDKQLHSPIGKIRIGKKIRVGEVPRIYGTIVPMALNNRVAYIETKDITYNIGDLSSVDHQFTNNRKYNLFYEASNNFMDSLKENNHLVATVGQMAPGGDWKLLSESLGESTKNATVFKLSFEHRPPYYNSSWAFGLGLYTISQSQLKFLMPILDFQYNFGLIKNNWLNIEGVLKTIFSGEADTTVAATNEKVKGAMWGYGFGGESVLFPYSKISFKAHGYYQVFNFIDYPEMTGVSVPLSKMSGIEIGGSISYLF